MDSLLRPLLSQVSGLSFDPRTKFPTKRTVSRLFRYANVPLSPFLFKILQGGRGREEVGRLSLLPPHHILMFSVFVFAGPQAQDLIVKDRDTGSSDPFAIFKVAGQEKRSRTIARNLNPKWEETFDFRVSSSG